MTIYPAIDIYEGKAVRLIRGDYAQMTVYGNDPVSVAHNFKAAGAEALHVVDLEGARDGKPANYKVIVKIAAETGLFVQVGGGIRSQENVRLYLNAGIRRVVLGTMAVSTADTLQKTIAAYGDNIAVSADIRDGFIAIKGWTELSHLDVMTFCRSIREYGVKTIICTDISKDGMQCGSNIELYRALCTGLPINIIASGGVSSLCEIETLASLGISGVILGKSLYEGDINLKEALQLVRRLTHGVQPH